MMFKFALGSIALFALTVLPASARTTEAAFYEVVNKETSANRRPAQECDARECRNWWWRDDGRFSLLAVEHIKAGGAERVLAVCWRDADSTDEMECTSTAGREFAVSSSDAENWRFSYMRANANPQRKPQLRQPPAGPALTLDLNCRAPVVTKGDTSPGRNPVVAAHVAVEQGEWSVVFQLADGSTVDRADQYNGNTVSAAEIAKNNADAKQPVLAQWAGGHKRKADVVMIGSLYQDAPGAYRAFFVRLTGLIYLI